MLNYKSEFYLNTPWVQTIEYYTLVDLQTLFTLINDGGELLDGSDIISVRYLRQHYFRFEQLNSLINKKRGKFKTGRYELVIKIDWSHYQSVFITNHSYITSTKFTTYIRRSDKRYSFKVLVKYLNSVIVDDPLVRGLFYYDVENGCIDMNSTDVEGNLLKMGGM